MPSESRGLLSLTQSITVLGAYKMYAESRTYDISCSVLRIAYAWSYLVLCVACQLRSMVVSTL